jgi:NAD(P)H-hydrate epimerase
VYQRSLRRDQVRQLDQLATDKYGVPSIVLMENAGRGVADVMCRLGINGPVLICCGQGNNGGDGLVTARHLDLRGHRVVIACWNDPQTSGGDTAINYRIVAASGLPLHVVPESSELDELLSGAEWVVDALLGTGSRGRPRPPIDRVIARLNESPARKLAVDIPSGLDCDTGEAADPTFRAHHTCTFVAPKPGLLLPSALPFVGQLHTLDIGAPRCLVESDEWGVASG